MKKAVINHEMTAMLRELIGQMFLSYDYASFFEEQVYGNLKINTEKFSIELRNEIEKFPFYDTVEDISCFSCKKRLPEEPFTPYSQGEPIAKKEIHEKIRSVQIVNDTINVNQGEYQCSFDMAVIIHTTEHRYIFSRGWFFGETIDVNVDRRFDDIYSIQQVIDDWSNDGENEVVVKRSTKSL